MEKWQLLEKVPEGDSLTWGPSPVSPTPASRTLCHSVERSHKLHRKAELLRLPLDPDPVPATSCSSQGEEGHLSEPHVMSTLLQAEPLFQGADARGTLLGRGMH